MSISVVAEILCDGSGRLGGLNYLVPKDMEVTAGDAVEVPIGKRNVNGMVLGPGNKSQATKEITKKWGKRADKEEIELAKLIAERNFSSLAFVASRLSPTKGRGSEPVYRDTVVLKDALDTKMRTQLDPAGNKNYFMRKPLTDYAALAATRAEIVAAKTPGAQILIICPTVKIVGEVLDKFEDGAVRLDAQSVKGGWAGFCEGRTRVGIGTRTAVLYSAPNLKEIIIVEEDHPGLIEYAQPHTNARDIAAVRTKVTNKNFSLIGANPTPSGLGSNVKLVEVGMKEHWPKMSLVDRRNVEPSQRAMPGKLKNKIDKKIRDGKTVLVIAPQKDIFVKCGHCGTKKGFEGKYAAGQCSQCGSEKENKIGWNAKRLKSVLGSKIKAGTRDTLKNYKNIDLLIIQDLDFSLNTPGFYPLNETAHLIMSAAAATSPTGEVIGLTNQPDNPVLYNLFIRKNQTKAAQHVWENAKAQKLPPFGRLLFIETTQTEKPETKNWKGDVFGPKKQGKNWKIVVKTDEKSLSTFKKHISTLRKQGKVKLTIS